MTILDEFRLAESCRALAASNPDFRLVIDRYGVPPLWEREPTFSTLVHIILEQQVSLASALAAFNKLRDEIGEVLPERVLALDDDQLRACYFSRQKASYVRGLARAVADGDLDLDALCGLDDQAARHELKKIKGIGDWTADIFLLMAMLRPDVMPKGDLALHLAYRDLKRLEKAPHSEEFQSIAQIWKPHRASAARLLWHFYLSEKRAKTTAS